MCRMDSGPDLLALTRCDAMDPQTIQMIMQLLGGTPQAGASINGQNGGGWGGGNTGFQQAMQGQQQQMMQPTPLPNASQVPNMQSMQSQQQPQGMFGGMQNQMMPFGQ